MLIRAYHGDISILVIPWVDLDQEFQERLVFTGLAFCRTSRWLSLWVCVPGVCMYCWLWVLQICCQTCLQQPGRREHQNWASIQWGCLQKAAVSTTASWWNSLSVVRRQNWAVRGEYLVWEGAASVAFAVSCAPSMARQPKTCLLDFAPTHYQLQTWRDPLPLAAFHPG